MPDLSDEEVRELVTPDPNLRKNILDAVRLLTEAGVLTKMGPGLSVTGARNELYISYNGDPQGNGPIGGIVFGMVLDEMKLAEITK